MSEQAVNDRAQYLLKSLVERYIRDGQPVGSKVLASDQSLNVSSATVRNVLADLESRGYLRSPHTSAGRVPTAQGYRFFIDSLLHVSPLSEATVASFRKEINPDFGNQALLQATSSMLSRITQLAGVVTLPRSKKNQLRQVEFLPLSGNRILVILVLNGEEVQNRIIYTDRAYKPNELEQAGNYLTQTFAGVDLKTIRSALLNSMQTERMQMNDMMQTSIDIAAKAFDQPDNNPDYLLEGQNNLFEIAEESGVSRLQSLFSAFTKKQDILHLLDQCLIADGVQIFLGEESEHDLLDGCSLVTAPYSTDGTVAGVLGVIGPTRMAYDQIIPIVDVTAKLLSSALK